MYKIHEFHFDRSESIPMGAPLTTPKSKMSGFVSQPVSSRRSRQAKARASKLRKMYGLDRVSGLFYQYIAETASYLPVM